MVKYRAKVDTYKDFKYIPEGTVIEEQPNFSNHNFECIENVSEPKVQPAAQPNLPDNTGEEETGASDNGNAAADDGKTEVEDADEGNKAQNFDDEDEMTLRNKARDLGIPNWHLCGIPLLKQRIEEKLAQPNLPDNTGEEETGASDNGNAAADDGKNTSDNA